MGTELNCSHLRSMTSGTLTATATPMRKGRTVHVWAIDLTDENGRMICIARCTLQVLKAPDGAEYLRPRLAEGIPAKELTNGRSL